VKRRIVSLAIGIASASMVVQAHHSIAAVYDTSRQVTVKGVLTAFRFVNPHPFLMIDVTDAAQKTQPWQLEIDNRWELVAIGVTAETWKAGDWIVVTGFPGRTQPHSLYVRTLDRPADGFRYEQVGGSPRIPPPRRNDFRKRTERSIRSNRPRAYACVAQDLSPGACGTHGSNRPGDSR
jgi:Family of unknown function (DUF6152)